MFSWLKRKKDDPKALLKKALGSFELPTFPAAVLRAMQKLRDPDAALAEVAEAISIDPGLSGRVLRVTNSPALGLRHPVRNVQHAVSLLGRSEVEALLLSVGVKGSIPDRAAHGYDPKRFWHAAARRAAAARGIAQRLHPATKNESFTAGLLADMAVPFLSRVRGESYGELLTAYHAGEAPLADLERSELGWSHAEIAGSMCHSWNFPVGLTDAIGAHHDTGEERKEVPAAVTLAAFLGEGDASSGRDQLVSTAQEVFAMQPDEVCAILDDADAQAVEIVRALG